MHVPDQRRGSRPFSFSRENGGKAGRYGEALSFLRYCWEQQFFSLFHGSCFVVLPLPSVAPYCLAQLRFYQCPPRNRDQINNFSCALRVLLFRSLFFQNRLLVIELLAFDSTKTLDRNCALNNCSINNCKYLDRIAAVRFPTLLLSFLPLLFTGGIASSRSIYFYDENSRRPRWVWYLFPTI